MYSTQLYGTYIGNKRGEWNDTCDGSGGGFECGYMKISCSFDNTCIDGIQNTNSSRTTQKNAFWS